MTDKHTVVQATFLFPDTLEGRERAAVVEHFARAVCLAGKTPLGKYKVTARDRDVNPECALAEEYAFSRTYNVYGGEAQERKNAIALIRVELAKDIEDQCSDDELREVGIYPVAGLKGDSLGHYQNWLDDYRAYAREEQEVGLKDPEPYQGNRLSVLARAEAIHALYESNDQSNDALAQAFDALHKAHVNDQRVDLLAIAHKHGLGGPKWGNYWPSQEELFESAYTAAVQIQRFVTSPTPLAYPE